MSVLSETEQAMQAAGVAVETPLVPIDFWSGNDPVTYYLPGQDNLPDQLKQYLVITPMNEGARVRYQSAVATSITVSRASGDARMKPDPGIERRALLERSITDWKIFREGRLVSHSPQNLKAWLEAAPTSVIDDVEKFVRKQNPWLVSEATVEDIDKAIAELQEQREEAVRREQGEATSSSR
jgi:hypothetical protein